MPYDPTTGTYVPVTNKVNTAATARLAGLARLYSQGKLPRGMARSTAFRFPNAPNLTRGQTADAARYTGLAITQPGGGAWPNLMSPGVAAHLGIPEATRLALGYGQNAPYTLPTGGGGGGGGGGGVGAGAVDTSLPPLHEIKWQTTNLNLNNARAPEWWSAMTPTDAKNVERPDVQYLMFLNTLIPFMSPEDQRKAAATLYSTSADAFSAYKNVSTNVPASDVVSTLTGAPGIDRSFFESAERARGAIDALSQMREKTVQGNRWKLGPGYTWLQQVLGAAEAFGGRGGERQSRTDYLRMLGQLDPLLAQGRTGDIGPTGMIGETLARPFFSGGLLRPATQVGNRMVFGTPNPLLFNA